MPSVFSRIAAGELPGRIVYEDESCFALLTNKPMKAGHTLVVPRDEIDSWLDVPKALHAHLFDRAQHVGRALQKAFSPVKVGVVVAGLEVRHVHVHLVPIDAIAELDFTKQREDTSENLDRAAAQIREALGTS